MTDPTPPPPPSDAATSPPAPVMPPAAPPDVGDPPPDEDEEGSFRSGLGQGLVWLGGALVPLALGAVIGYWLADRETRWVPTMVGALCLVALVAAVCMAAGLYLLGPYAGHRRGRRRIAALALLAALAAGARLVAERLGAPSPLTALDRDAFELAARLDARQMHELDRALDRTVLALGQLPGLSPATATAPDGSPRALSADEERAIVEAWQVYLQAALALDRIRLFYEDYYRFDLSRVERPRHLRSYLLTFAAELALYEHTASLMEVIDRNANATKLLDLERPELGLAAGSLTAIRGELAGTFDLTRVVAGRAYLSWLRLVHRADREAIALGVDDLWGDVERLLGLVERRRGAELAAISVGNEAAPLGRRVKGFTFPVQAKVAEWMGDTRVGRPVGRYLISREQLEQARARLAPGDVMLGRKNWYLSNVGLPGFWPHALLWTGTTDDLRRTFDQDAETTAWVARQGGTGTFTEHLARTYPLAWAERAAPHGVGHSEIAREDDALEVVEAISEGVVQNTFAKAVGDYLVAMRPRLPVWVKAQAIARAFGYLGRPYDFDFDFATDQSLVCTELVWRSYRPLGDAPGLRLDPIQVAGRRALPANEIARVFQREAGHPDRQLDFVLFLDAVEAEHKAVLADEGSFARSPDRSQWDIDQR